MVLINVLGIYLLGLLISVYSDKLEQLKYLQKNLIMPKLQDVYRDADQVFLGEHPYVASVMSYNMHMCTGAVISDNLVLTAARCFINVQDSQKITIRVGSTDVHKGGEVYQVSRITLPNRFYEKESSIQPSEERMFYDLACLKTNDPIMFSEGFVDKIDIAFVKRGMRDAEYNDLGRFAMVAWARSYESLIDEELQELHLVRVNGSLYYMECSLFYLDMYLPMYQRPCFTSCYLEDSSNYNTEPGRNYVRNCPRYIAALGGLVIDSKDKKLVGLASWGFNLGGDSGKTFPVMFTLLEQTPYQELVSCALNEFNCRDIVVM